MAVPTYLLIAADLRSKIVAGKMRPGTQLPPEMNLQDEYGNLSGTVSRNTVRDAIDMLVREGLLERRGQGTFIVGTPDSLAGYTSSTWLDPSSSIQMHLGIDGHIWPDRDESTRAAVDAVITARTEQRRNSGDVINQRRRSGPV